MVEDGRGHGVMRGPAENGNAAIRSIAQLAKSGAIIDRDSLERSNRVLDEIKIGDNMSKEEVGRLTSAIVTTRMYEHIDDARKADIGAGELRVLVDLSGQQVNIPIEKNGQK